MAARVYVIDDDDRFRDSLCALIRSVGLDSTGWNNPKDLLENSSLERPGCVVLDYRLPTLSGLEVLRLIRRTSSIPAILISAYADVQTAVAAMEMGASTVFEKPLDDNAFLNALERFCFDDARRLSKRRLCSAVQDYLATLSEVERATLEQMRLGHSNKAIARNLQKSVKAIERYRQNIVHKLHSQSAIEALQKVQICPLQEYSPLTCSGDSCMAGWIRTVK
jgi:two-component system, LuxR family, response regulator FixJ